jgi:UDP-N-acetylmuramoyl-tripeptide--D-alanyl-D-alanine ligase
MSALQNNAAKFSFEEIREAIGTTGAETGQIEGVVTDSREVKTGNLFVALKGERFNGNDFVEQANATGAATVGNITSSTFQVADTLQALGNLAKFHRERFEIPVVAITGSYGKTSTRALTYAALQAGLETLTSQGNFNNEIGLPMTLFQLEANHEAAVLEMGMRGLGQIDYLAKIAEPTIGIITNIGPQHIELLGTEENIAVAKAELLENLPQNGLAILPADSPFLDSLKSKAKCAVATFGQSETADFRVSNVKTEESGNISFEISILNSNFEIHLPITGVHNAINAAAAFATAYCLEIPPEKIIEGFGNVELPGARMRVLKLENNVTVIDDCYNAGPDSTRAALQTLLDYPGSGRRVAVLGAMKELGDQSELKHREIGVLAGIFCDVLIGVGGDTRPLLNAAVASAKQNEVELEAHWCDNAEEAKTMTADLLQNGDVVLVKGSRSVGLEVVVEALKIK